MVQIKLKGVIGVENPSPKSFWCGETYRRQMANHNFLEDAALIWGGYGQ